MHRIESKTAGETSTKSPRSLARPLVFLVVTSIAFVAGLYLWPSAVKGYRVQETIDLLGDGAGPRVHGDARQHLAAARDAALASDNLAAALKHVGPPPRVPRTTGADFPTASEIDFIKRRITVEPIDVKNSSDTSVAVSFTGQDAKWSVSLVREVIERALESLSHPAAPEPPVSLASAEARLTDARHHEQAARLALDDFLVHHFDEINRRGPGDLESQTLAGGNSSQQAAPPKPTINPQWQALSDQLSVLTAQYERLLQGRTPEHPQVQETAYKIETTRQQLEQIPQYLQADVSAPSIQEAERKAIHPVGPAQFTQPESVVRVTAAGKKYERLLADLQLARTAREAAQLNFEAVSDEAQKSAAAAPVVRGRIVATAHLAQTLWEAPAANRLTVLALASVFVGACVATMIRVPSATAVLMTTEDVEAKLSLPVVGMVPSPSRPAAPLSR